jgi:hypothetical protein
MRAEREARGRGRRSVWALVPAAIMLLGACGDDDPTTLASGEDVELAGDNDLGGQTLDINAEEEDGDVDGEVLFTDSDNADSSAVVTVECADTDTDGVVILGGEITSSSDSSDTVGDLVALFIREGDPDSVALWFDEGENASCSELVENRHDVLDDDSAFVDVEAGSDIETG